MLLQRCRGCRCIWVNVESGVRFPLRTLYRRFLQYLGLSATQISLNAWRVFLGAEVLYEVMSDGANRMTMEKFFHCYRPSEITQSKGMYNFVPRSLLLRLVCNTPDSNKNWKGRYFFIQGDEWMCHPSKQEYMPVTKHGALCPRPVCIHLHEVFTFLTFVIF